VDAVAGGSSRRRGSAPMPTRRAPDAGALPPAGEATPFTALGLSPAVLRAVAAVGFEGTSPIQAAAIPLILSGHDVVGQSETGSGKTAAFCIPAIERVDPRVRSPQVLMLAPTRELAMQITAEVRKLAAFVTSLQSVAIYGGAAYERQFAELKRGPQIVVGTPGRLTDHMARGTLDLAAVRMLILDEADRMLDLGFQEDVEKVLAAAPAGRQTVFFSATFSPSVQALVRRHSRDARMVTIAKQITAGPPLVDQVYYEVRHHAKLAALCRVIDFHDVGSGLIFCNTQRMVEELADALTSRGCTAERLHGGMAQPQRTRVMESFRRRAFRFLVATDVAARGIDVNDLELVVNYDLPYDAEDYVHRIGRTGRAGRAGRAVTLVSGGGIRMLRTIERFTGTRLRQDRLPTVEMVARRRGEAMVERLRETLAGGPFPHEDRVVERLVAEGRPPAAVAAAILHQFAAIDVGGDDGLDRDEPKRRPPHRHSPGRHDHGRRSGRPPKSAKRAGRGAKRREK